MVADVVELEQKSLTNLLVNQSDRQNFTLFHGRVQKIAVVGASQMHLYICVSKYTTLRSSVALSAYQIQTL